MFWLTSGVHVQVAVENTARETHQGMPELQNIIIILYENFGNNPVVKFLHNWENIFFSFLVAIILSLLAYLASRRRELIPSGSQNFMETVVEFFDNFICGILGPNGRHYVPFLGTLFIYIIFMNLFVLIPGMKSPTSSINTTAALAICVFIYVQYTGIRRRGLIGYFDHLAGEPRDIVTIILAPLMFVLHTIGELAKPLSLSLRLFGNITGEDVLIAVFVMLGVATLSFMHLPIGLPLQALVFPLVLLFSTIQATVFTLLSTIYLYMMMPDEEEHH